MLFGHTWALQWLIQDSPEVDVHGSVHRNINLIERKPTRRNHVVEFIIPVFLNCSTCFGQHTAHHEELKNCNCSLWFYIRFTLPAAAMAEPSQRPQPKTYVKPEAAITVFELLMISSVSSETCWAIKKHWNNEFYYTVASCWFFVCDSPEDFINIHLSRFSPAENVHSIYWGH
jgi:hypothetical protein